MDTTTFDMDTATPGAVRRVIERAVTHQQRIPDAHLAAIAIEHSLILYSADGDFVRFKQLKWENPIVEPSR